MNDPEGALLSPEEARANARRRFDAAVTAATDAYTSDLIAIAAYERDAVGSTSTQPTPTSSKKRGRRGIAINPDASPKEWEDPFGRRWVQEIGAGPHGSIFTSCPKYMDEKLWQEPCPQGGAHFWWEDGDAGYAKHAPAVPGDPYQLTWRCLKCKECEYSRV